MHKNKSAFTLAELLIVLVVIGVLLAVLIPSAVDSMPNEDVMKFKKAHNSLSVIIRELAGSDTYYKNGDLAILKNGATVTGTSLCTTLADVVTVKSQSCASTTSKVSAPYVSSTTALSTIMTTLDTKCAAVTNLTNVNYFTTPDDIIWFDPGAADHFGTFTTIDTNGFYQYYKVFCIDIDGVNKGEAPFGYGIRRDGKLLVGTRATQWLQKSMNNKD